MFADKGHYRARLPADASAFTAKKCPMGATPVVQRSVTLTLHCGELGADLVERQHLDFQSFDDADRRAASIGDNAQGTWTWRRNAYNFIRPYKARGGTFNVCDAEVGEGVGIRFIVIEVKHVE